MKWISVEDKLPDGTEEVLIFVKDDWEGNTNFVTVDMPPFKWTEEVSHWMPLPDPPEVSAQKEDKP